MGKWPHKDIIKILAHLLSVDALPPPHHHPPPSFKNEVEVFWELEGKKNIFEHYKFFAFQSHILSLLKKNFSYRFFSEFARCKKFLKFFKCTNFRYMNDKCIIFGSCAHYELNKFFCTRKAEYITFVPQRFPKSELFGAKISIQGHISDVLGIFVG